MSNDIWNRQKQLRQHYTAVANVLIKNIIQNVRGLETNSFVNKMPNNSIGEDTSLEYIKYFIRVLYIYLNFDLNPIYKYRSNYNPGITEELFIRVVEIFCNVSEKYLEIL